MSIDSIKSGPVTVRLRALSGDVPLIWVDDDGQLEGRFLADSL